MAQAKPNTYNWTCPRCGNITTSLTPTIPDRCSRCGMPSGVDPELEREDEAAAAVAEPDEPFVSPQPGQSIADAIRRGQTFTVAPYQVDEGWLLYVIRRVLRNEGMALIGLDRLGRGEEETREDSESLLRDFAHDVTVEYGNERPTLLCGCKAGEHGETTVDMAAAHPERIS